MRYFTWVGAGTHIWDHEKIKTYEKLSDALANVEKKRTLMRVIAASKTSMYAHLLPTALDVDLTNKTLTKAQYEEEKKIYLAWCNSSTEVCGAEGEGAIPSVSTNIEMENEDGRISDAAPRDPAG